MAHTKDTWVVKGFKGPTLQTESKLFRDIGSSNLISLELEDPKDVADERTGHLPTEQGAQNRLGMLQSLLDQLTTKPLEICGRSFAYCLHKVEHQTEEAKCFLVAVGSSVEICSSPDSPAAGSPPGQVEKAPLHWSSAGGTVFAQGWETASEARAHLANFESLAPAKMAKRLGLALSPAISLFHDPLYKRDNPLYKRHDYLSFKWVPHVPELEADIDKLPPPPEGVVQFVEWDEVYAVPGDETTVMTDGCGRLSMDLALGIPKIESGRVRSQVKALPIHHATATTLTSPPAPRIDLTRYQSPTHLALLSPHSQSISLHLRSQGEQPEYPGESAPFALQARVWVFGNVAKGVWLVDPRLPDRTILIGKDKQLKVKGTPECLAALKGIPTFEVLRTYERPQTARFGVYNLTLLDQVWLHLPSPLLFSSPPLSSSLLLSPPLSSS